MGVNIFRPAFVSGVEADSNGNEVNDNAVPAIMSPQSNHLGGFLRNVHRDPEIGYLYKNLQHYVIDRLQRSAVQEPKVGNEVELFDDLLENHGQDDRTVYTAEERKVVKGKILELVRLMNISHVTGNGGDL